MSQRKVRSSFETESHNGVVVQSPTISCPLHPCVRYMGSKPNYSDTAQRGVRGENLSLFLLDNHAQIVTNTSAVLGLDTTLHPSF
jgi:hypothetical protein